jgi:hypothetical protein
MYGDSLVSGYLMIHILPESKRWFFCLNQNATRYKRGPCMAIRLLLLRQMKHVSGCLMMFSISEIKGVVSRLYMKPVSGLFYNINCVKH